MTALVTRLRERRPDRILVDGKPIRARFLQGLIWSGVVAACGAALVAGGYFNLLQVDWHIHAGTVSAQLFYLKHWWDDGLGHRITSAAWPLYRHGLRDIGEPAVATLWVKTLLAQRKYWNRRAGPVYLVLAPFALIAVAGVLIVAGIWLLDFALPNAWHALFGGYRVVEPGVVAGLWSAGATVLVGVVIGLVIHKIWAPAGATIQGYWVDRAVDRSRLAGTTPLWVRWPIAPVQLRERFSVMMADLEQTVTERDAMNRWVIIGVSVVVAYFVVTGFVAHFWVGAGHHFPYLAP